MIDLNQKNNATGRVEKHILELIRIGFYQPGAKITTVRELAARLKVAHVTAARAIKNLANKGILQSKVGSGTFIAHNLPPSFAHSPKEQAGGGETKTLYFFFSHGSTNGMDSYHAEILCAIQREAMTRQWELKLGLLTSDALTSAGRDPNAVGIIYGAVMEKFPPLQQHVPVILYAMAPKQESYCCVTPDNYAAGFDAAREIAAEGFTKSCFINSADSKRDLINNLHFIERERGFIDGCNCMGIKLRPTLSWSVQTGETGEITAMLEEFSKIKERQAIVVGNRSMAYEISLKAVELGLKIPDRLAMITFINRGGLESSVDLSTYDFNRDLMAEISLRLLDDAIAGKKLPQRVLLPMHLNSKCSVATSNFCAEIRRD